MIRRLRKKFIFAAAAAVFLVLLVLIGTINILNYSSMIRQADETLQILSANKGSFPRQMLRTRQERQEGEIPPPEEERNGFFGGRRSEYGELAFQSRYFSVRFDSEGQCVKVDLDNLASLTEAEARTLAGNVYASGRERGFADTYRFCRTADGEETLMLFLSCEREINTFRTFLYASAGVSMGGLLAVLLLLGLFSGRIIRPIAESYEKQKQFITDAGHELKTPITIIQADAEVLASELEGENEWITDIRRQTKRLTELTADLIYLSRMEEENAALKMREFSLSELAEETARSFQSVAVSQGKTFRLAIAPEVRLTGDEKAMEKLLSVLLDNAMKYSPEGGRVELSLEKAGRSARLRVRNTCLPMEKGSADRLFERFTRADTSRNSQSGGFGLGLAIAKAVTEAHRGKIRAESEDGVSLTVSAEIPLN